MNMLRKIYHGSSHIVRRPSLGLGRSYNDFGIGFYCTENQLSAAEWAVGRENNGFVTSYSMDCSGLKITDLTAPQYTILHWISMLLSYREFDFSSRLMYDAAEYISREFSVSHQGSDVIIGYSAGDCRFALTSDFLRGLISYDNLKHALQNGRRQFVLKSNRAFDRILYTGYDIAYFRERFPLMNSCELSSLKTAYRKDVPDALYVDKILEERINAYDARL